MSENDTFCRDLLSAGRSVEARNWLAAKPDGEVRAFGELSDRETSEFVDQLYALGAESVTAAEVHRDPEFGEGSNAVVVELPAAGNERDALIAFEARHAEPQGFDPTGDIGQHFMFLKF